MSRLVFKSLRTILRWQYRQENGILAAIMIRVVCTLLLAAAATAVELPDIRSVPPDLTVPSLTNSSPCAGKRVKHRLTEYKNTPVYHALYLPTDWKPSTKFPVIVEYAGNGGFSNEFGDVSLGVPEGSKLGYGISAGKGFIWICMPYIAIGRQKIETTWWGDVDATLEYCKKAVRMVCDEFGGDSSKVFLTGFSRGAIGCGYLGLHDDEIAKLWCAFIPYSHYDGAIKWSYPASDAASAVARMKRLNGRPSFICQERSVEVTQRFIETSGVKAPFTFQAVPFRNHSDEWILRPSETRTALRAWMKDIVAK